MLYALCSMPLQIYNLQSDPNQRALLFLNRNPTLVQKMFKTQGGEPRQLGNGGIQTLY
jgi:hypothetical protein